MPENETAHVKVALLGTGFGQAHAAVYAARPDVSEVVVFGRTPKKLQKIADEFGFTTSTDLDATITDPSVDLVDVCLPTALHAEVAVAAMRAGKDVLIELPLALTMDDAGRIIEVAHASGRAAFVDMFSRFSPANAYLRDAVHDQRHGPLLVLEVAGRTALLWEGYSLGLDSLALDMMHADFDLVTSLLGAPDSIRVAGVPGRDGRGSAATVLLDYPTAVARCSSSSLMPTPYGMRGGYRATFADTVLEYTMRAGFTAQGPSTLTEYTDAGERTLPLSQGSPYAQMIDHVLACLRGDADNRIAPDSALPALQLTLDVHHR